MKKVKASISLLPVPKGPISFGPPRPIGQVRIAPPYAAAGFVETELPPVFTGIFVEAAGPCEIVNLRFDEMAIE